jgi:hypothetical protein
LLSFVVDCVVSKSAQHAPAAMAEEERMAKKIAQV